MCGSDVSVSTEQSVINERHYFCRQTKYKPRHRAQDWIAEIRSICVGQLGPFLCKLVGVFLMILRFCVKRLRQKIVIYILVILVLHPELVSAPKDYNKLEHLLTL